MKRLVYRVSYLRGRRAWRVRLGRGKLVAGTKREATEAARLACQLNARLGRRCQLVVHNRDGRIAFEHTYPRSSDPARYPS